MDQCSPATLPTCRTPGERVGALTDMHGQRRAQHFRESIHRGYHGREKQIEGLIRTSGGEKISEPAVTSAIEPKRSARIQEGAACQSGSCSKAGYTPAAGAKTQPRSADPRAAVTGNRSPQLGSFDDRRAHGEGWR